MNIWPFRKTPSQRLAASMRPDPVNRARSMAQLSPERRMNRDKLKAELSGVGRG